MTVWTVCIVLNIPTGEEQYVADTKNTSFTYDRVQRQVDWLCNFVLLDSKRKPWVLPKKDTTTSVQKKGGNDRNERLLVSNAQEITKQKHGEIKCHLHCHKQEKSITRRASLLVVIPKQTRDRASHGTKHFTFSKNNLRPRVDKNLERKNSNYAGMLKSALYTAQSHTNSHNRTHHSYAAQQQKTGHRPETITDSWLDYELMDLGREIQRLPLILSTQ